VKKRTTLLLSLSVTIAGLTAAALATPTLNLMAPILALGATARAANAHGVAQLPNGDYFNAAVTTDGPANFIVQDVVYGPGGHTGWHSHPGILLITVIEGSIEWYDSLCNRHVYNTGDSFTEGSQHHYYRTLGNANSRTIVTYVIGKGLPRRVDDPEPACAVALGLN
jgi:quercetin dioxygenase-like cupin family protein